MRTIKLLTGDEYPILSEARVSQITTLAQCERNLIGAIGAENLTKRSYTEKYTNKKLVLYYYNGEHIATYNKEKKTVALFY